MGPSKLPFPGWAANTPCDVMVNKEGLSEDGETEEAFQWSGDCVYSEKAYTVVNAENRLIRLSGKVIIKGDIAPDLPTLSDGTVKVSGQTYRVYRNSRPRNPDGTVHHTTLELM